MTKRFLTPEQIRQLDELGADDEAAERTLRVALNFHANTASDDKRIEEILARHLHEEGSFPASMLCPQTHEDRADLLIFISRHREEIQRLREELRWYADPRNHFPLEIRKPGDPDPAVVFVEEQPITLDGGERARRALEAKP